MTTFAGVANRTRHREHPRFDARDVNEVSDESPHPGARSLHAPRMRHHPLDVVLLRDFLLDERRNAHHRVQQIQQVVADDAHEIIPHRERFVGSFALMGQVLVRRVTFLRQQGDVLGALTTKDVISRQALTLQDVILDGS